MMSSNNLLNFFQIENCFNLYIFTIFIYLSGDTTGNPSYNYTDN